MPLCRGRPRDIYLLIHSVVRLCGRSGPAARARAGSPPIVACRALEYAGTVTIMGQSQWRDSTSRRKGARRARLGLWDRIGRCQASCLEPQPWTDLNRADVVLKSTLYYDRTEQRQPWLRRGGPVPSAARHFRCGELRYQTRKPVVTVCALDEGVRGALHPHCRVQASPEQF